MNNNNIDKGHLQVSVFATDVGMPATNATVRITERGASNRIIEEIITDEYVIVSYAL